MAHYATDAMYTRLYTRLCAGLYAFVCPGAKLHLVDLAGSERSATSYDDLIALYRHRRRHAYIGVADGMPSARAGTRRYGVRPPRRELSDGVRRHAQPDVIAY